MRNASIFVLTVGALALTGCSDKPFEPEPQAIDPDAPIVHITTPKLGAFKGDVAMVEVAGTCSDNDHVASIEVNGVAAQIIGDGTWTAMVPVTTGTQLLHAIAKDGQGNLAKETRAVVTGPMTPIATAVPEAITASLSAQTFDAIGRGVTGYLETADLAALIAPQNPIVDFGSGSQFLSARASITGLTVGDATTVSLVPRAGGLALDVELDQVAVQVHLSWTIATADGSTDVTVSASHIKITGNLDVGVLGKVFDIKLTDQDVKITGFDVDLGAVPNKILDILHLEAAIAPVIGLLAEKIVVPMLNTALAGLVNTTQTLDVLGTSIDIDVSPARIDFDASGAILALDTVLRAQGDASSPGYVYVANLAPAMSTEHGFQLAIADDAANQLLGSFWAAKGMDLTFDLTTGSYADLGKLYDRVELSAKVPPYVDAHGGALKLTIGDLIATFKDGDQIATQVAISAEVEIKVVTGTDGAPRLDVGSPTTYVDVLDQGVDGANSLSSAQFEAITSFALSRVVAFGSGAVGAIPLPSIGGVALHDVVITEHSGYLVVDGEIQ